MFGAELTLKKTNMKERVDWVGEWQRVALTESYSRIKISVYRRVERDNFSLEVLQLISEKEMNKLKYHCFLTPNESMDSITNGC